MERSIYQTTQNDRPSTLDDHPIAFVRDHKNNNSPHASIRTAVRETIRQPFAGEPGSVPIFTLELEFSQDSGRQWEQIPDILRELATAIEQEVRLQQTPTDIQQQGTIGYSSLVPTGDSLLDDDCPFSEADFKEDPGLEASWKAYKKLDKVQSPDKENWDAKIELQQHIIARLQKRSARSRSATGGIQSVADITR